MVDKANIKKAFDDFEDENFTDAADTLRKEVRGGTNTFLKDKLGLKNDPLEIEQDNEE